MADLDALEAEIAAMLASSTPQRSTKKKKKGKSDQQSSEVTTLDSSIVSVENVDAVSDAAANAGQSRATSIESSAAPGNIAQLGTATTTLPLQSPQRSAEQAPDLVSASRSVPAPLGSPASGRQEGVNSVAHTTGSRGSREEQQGDAQSTAKQAPAQVAHPATGGNTAQREAHGSNGASPSTSPGKVPQPVRTGPAAAASGTGARGASVGPSSVGQPATALPLAETPVGKLRQLHQQAKSVGPSTTTPSSTPAAAAGTGGVTWGHTQNTSGRSLSRKAAGGSTAPVSQHAAAGTAGKVEQAPRSSSAQRERAAALAAPAQVRTSGVAGAESRSSRDSHSSVGTPRRSASATAPRSLATPAAVPSPSAHLLAPTETLLAKRREQEMEDALLRARVEADKASAVKGGATLPLASTGGSSSTQRGAVAEPVGGFTPVTPGRPAAAVARVMLLSPVTTPAPVASTASRARTASKVAASSTKVQGQEPAWSAKLAEVMGEIESTPTRPPATAAGAGEEKRTVPHSPPGMPSIQDVQAALQAAGAGDDHVGDSGAPEVIVYDVSSASALGAVPMPASLASAMAAASATPPAAPAVPSARSVTGKHDLSVAQPLPALKRLSKAAAPISSGNRRTARAGDAAGRTSQRSASAEPRRRTSLVNITVVHPPPVPGMSGTFLETDTTRRKKEAAEAQRIALALARAEEQRRAVAGAWRSPTRMMSIVRPAALGRAGAGTGAAAATAAASTARVRSRSVDVSSSRHSAAVATSLQHTRAGVAGPRNAASGVSRAPLTAPRPPPDPEEYERVHPVLPEARYIPGQGHTRGWVDITDKTLERRLPEVRRRAASASVGRDRNSRTATAAGSAIGSGAAAVAASRAAPAAPPAAGTSASRTQRSRSVSSQASSVGRAPVIRTSRGLVSGGAGVHPLRRSSVSVQAEAERELQAARAEGLLVGSRERAAKLGLPHVHRAAEGQEGGNPADAAAQRLYEEDVHDRQARVAERASALPPGCTFQPVITPLAQELSRKQAIPTYVDPAQVRTSAASSSIGVAGVRGRTGGRLSAPRTTSGDGRSPQQRPNEQPDSSSPRAPGGSFKVDRFQALYAHASGAVHRKQGHAQEVQAYTERNLTFSPAIDEKSKQMAVAGRGRMLRAASRDGKVGGGGGSTSARTEGSASSAAVPVPEDAELLLSGRTTDRLYAYKAVQDAKRQALVAEHEAATAPRPPHINERSKALASVRRPRSVSMGSRAGDAGEEKAAILEAKKREQDLAGCTFKPAINARSVVLASKYYGQPSAATPSSTGSTRGSSSSARKSMPLTGVGSAQDAVPVYASPISGLDSSPLPLSVPAQHRRLKEEGERTAEKIAHTRDAATMQEAVHATFKPDLRAGSGRRGYSSLDMRTLATSLPSPGQTGASSSAAAPRLAPREAQTARPAGAAAVSPSSSLTPVATSTTAGQRPEGMQMTLTREHLPSNKMSTDESSGLLYYVPAPSQGNAGAGSTTAAPIPLLLGSTPLMSPFSTGGLSLLPSASAPAPSPATLATVASVASLAQNRSTTTDFHRSSPGSPLLLRSLVPYWASGSPPSSSSSSSAPAPSGQGNGQVGDGQGDGPAQPASTQSSGPASASPRQPPLSTRKEYLASKSTTPGNGMLNGDVQGQGHTKAGPSSPPSRPQILAAASEATRTSPRTTSVPTGKLQQDTVREFETARARLVQSTIVQQLSMGLGGLAGTGPSAAQVQAAVAKILHGLEDARPLSLESRPTWDRALSIEKLGEGQALLELEISARLVAKDTGFKPRAVTARVALLVQASSLLAAAS